MKKSDLFWQSYLGLEREAIELSKYIYITDEVIVNNKGMETTENCISQLTTFSPYIADLLIRCCVQIEAIAKELYYENGGSKQRGDNSIYFDEDCLKLIDIKWETHKKCVMVIASSFNLTKDENRILKPLKEAHKRQGTCWEKAYQAVKHDRYASLRLGNVKAFIHALAALYLLNLYYRKDSWITKYDDIQKSDYSMGSSLFAVKPPASNQLWYNNQPISSESPYSVVYTDAGFNRITDIQKAENEALNNYWKRQPELNEMEFVEQIKKAQEEERNDPSKRVMYIWELAKYRLNKEIPQSLSFEEKKSLLIKSEAWNCFTNQRNEHLKTEEITEENIQEEINLVGIRWGMEIQSRYEKLEWIKTAMSSNICKVFIP